MSIGLPATTTCRMMGHAWVTRIEYDSDGPTHVEVCSRCQALNDRAAAYVPRHLRQHGEPANTNFAGLSDIAD
jgi:hypothetical protein